MIGKIDGVLNSKSAQDLEKKHETASVKRLGPEVKKDFEKSTPVEKTKINELQFSVDSQTGIQTIKIVDQATGDVIRQAPTDQVVEMARAMSQNKKGVFIKESL